MQQYSTHDELPPAVPDTKHARLFSRSVWWMIGGMLLGVLIMSVVWMLSSWSEDTAASFLLSEVSRPAPDFVLPTLDGSTVRLSDYRGKVVLVNFWATWCEPCKEETPELQSVYQQLRDQGFVIIGVNLRDKETPGPTGDAEIHAFIARYGMSYPVALDTTGTAARAFQLSPIPTSYVVDQTGTIRFVRIGKMTAAEIERLIEKTWQEP